MSVWSIATAAMVATAAVGVVQQATQAAQPAPSITIVAKPVPTKAKARQVTTKVVSKPARAIAPQAATTIVQLEPARAIQAQVPTSIAQEAAPSIATAIDAEPAWLAQEADDEGQRVSASFNHAAASEVLDWLTKNGVNFATADSELPKGETITLNVKDRPINEVLDAIASAMGGHWERRGGMRIFRKGEGFSFMNGEPGAFTWTTPEGAKAWNLSPKDGKVFSFGKDGKAWNLAPGGKGWTTDPGKIKVFGKDGEHVFVMPEMGDMKEWKLAIPDMKEFKLDMEKMKSLKEMPGFSEQARKEMEEAMKEAHNNMYRSGEEMKISRKAMEEARKAMEKARKEHPGAFEGHVFVSPDHDGLFKVMPRGDGKNNFEFRLGKDGMRNAPFSIGIDGKSFTKFVDSLSDEQREINRRQGYLRARDLSAAQKKMLGIDNREKGDWTIKISKDGQDVTIKSD